MKKNNSIGISVNKAGTVASFAQHYISESLQRHGSISIPALNITIQSEAPSESLMKLGNPTFEHEQSASR